MPLDQSFIGRTYDVNSLYEVSREKIREFADAVGDDNLAYRDVEHARALGHRDIVAPPTLPIIITMAAAERIITDPKIGLDFARVVHGDQRFTYHRPVYAGDRLVATVSITDISSRAGNDFMSTRTEIATEAGEPVLDAYSLLVVRAAD